MKYLEERQMSGDFDVRSEAVDRHDVDVVVGEMTGRSTDNRADHIAALAGRVRSGGVGFGLVAERGRQAAAATQVHSRRIDSLLIRHRTRYFWRSQNL